MNCTGKDKHKCEYTLTNLFYITLSIIPFFLKNYIIIKYDNNRYTHN